MKKNIPLVVLVVLIFVVTVTAGGVVIPPGGESTLSSMPADSGSSSNNGNFTFSLVSGFDVNARRIRAASLTTPAAIGTGTASSQIFYEFTVGSTPKTAGNTVKAVIDYLVAWEGAQLIMAVGASNATVGVELVLRDMTEGRNLRIEPIHDLDLQTHRVKFVLIGGVNFNDSGSKVSAFPAILERGHTYRLTLRMSTNLFLVTIPISGSFAESNYSGDGVQLGRLTVKIGLDEEAVLNRFEAIEERLGDIEDRLDALENHRHVYLTGRGVGHNNLEATSSPPVFAKPAVSPKIFPQTLLEENPPVIKPEEVQTGKPILQER